MSKQIRESLQVDEDTLYQIIVCNREKEGEIIEFFEKEGVTHRTFLTMKYGTNWNPYKRLLVETLLLEKGYTFDKDIKRHHAR